MARVSVKGWELRLGLFLAVLVALTLNALAPWGEDAAQYGYAALQALTGITATVCTVVVARRVSGPARTWRLLVLAALLSWLAGEVLWQLRRVMTGSTSAPWPSIVAYFLPPVLSFVAMLLLARTWGGVPGRWENAIRHHRVISLLDGFVAATSFSILTIVAGVGGAPGSALPRSDSLAVATVYSIVELIVVVSAVLMAMTYRADRPYRANYLLLACGVVLLAASDRMIAYFSNIGEVRGELWGGFGFVLGPLLIAYAVLDRPERPAQGLARDFMDWVQLTLPYAGFIGIAMLLVYHLMIGRLLSPVLLYTVLAMALAVAARQVLAVRAQRLLTQRLYQTQRRLAHQVHHDSLTGLPNRLLFAQRLDAAIRRGPFDLIFVDLDDFKDVNDRFGHAGGDELLGAVGERLTQCLGPADTLARIGGDEFAILIDGEHEAPEVVADRIRVAMRDPFAVHGSSIRVRASMGLVRPDLSEPTLTSDDLLRQADVSMYAGKRVGKDTAVIYRPALGGVTTDFPTALRRAKGAVPPGFSLEFQPVVRLPDAATVAVEALARWTAPNGTQIQPDAFVAAAEAAGLGAALDVMVLGLACDEVTNAGMKFPLHVNIGAARLGSLEFEEKLLRTLDRCEMTPHQLVLEITEMVPIVDLPDAAAQIARLTARGIRVALDDFGAGYNSLTYIHALPVQIIKLDRGLAIGSVPERVATLYRSVIRLCDEMGLEVIAEGIESAAQADILYDAGCRLAQGHLFGRPAPIADMRSLPGVPEMGNGRGRS